MRLSKKSSKNHRNILVNFFFNMGYIINSDNTSQEICNLSIRIEVVIGLILEKCVIFV